MTKRKEWLRAVVAAILQTYATMMLLPAPPSWSADGCKPVLGLMTINLNRI